MCMTANKGTQPPPPCRDAVCACASLWLTKSITRRLPCTTHCAGVFKSTYHRVRAPVQGDPTGDRYSIPYFVNPRLNYVMQVRSGVCGGGCCAGSVTVGSSSTSCPARICPAAPMAGMHV